jgi:predicted small secreted protein
LGDDSAAVLLPTHNERFTASGKRGAPLARLVFTMNPILISNCLCRSRQRSSEKPSRIRFFSLTAGALVLVLASAASSCHTTRGFGRDVEKVGEEIQEASHEATR